MVTVMSIKKAPKYPGNSQNTIVTYRSHYERRSLIRCTYFMEKIDQYISDKDTVDNYVSSTKHPTVPQKHCKFQPQLQNSIKLLNTTQYRPRNHFAENLLGVESIADSINFVLHGKINCTRINGKKLGKISRKSIDIPESCRSVANRGQIIVPLACRFWPKSSSKAQFWMFLTRNWRQRNIASCLEVDN
jgi:hypothetical protein